LYEYTLGVIEDMRLRVLENIEDIYSNGDIPNLTDIQTTFEKKHLEDGKKIKYLRIRV
jgi:tRNA (guanine-N7-)-methyltransferase